MTDRNRPRSEAIETALAELVREIAAVSAAVAPITATLQALGWSWHDSSRRPWGATATDITPENRALLSFALNRLTLLEHAANALRTLLGLAEDTPFVSRVPEAPIYPTPIDVAPVLAEVETKLSDLLGTVQRARTQA